MRASGLSKMKRDSPHLELTSRGRSQVEVPTPVLDDMVRQQNEYNSLGGKGKDGRKCKRGEGESWRRE